jgi:hypothetical protein
MKAILRDGVLRNFPGNGRKIEKCKRIPRIGGSLRAVWSGNWDPLFETKWGTRRKKHDSGTTIIISLVGIGKLSCNIAFPLDLVS